MTRSTNRTPCFFWIAACALLLCGCESAASQSDTDAALGGTDASQTLQRCPGEQSIAFDTPVVGQTSAQGWSADLTSWYRRSDVACDPFGTDYPPPFQVYSLTIPPKSDWDVVATPEPGVDVSLVTWQQGAADTTCSPLRGVGVVSCDVANKQPAAGAERIRLNAANNPYHVVILVTTPPGGAAGGFTLRVVTHQP